MQAAVLQFSSARRNLKCFDTLFFHFDIKYSKKIPNNCKNKVNYATCGCHGYKAKNKREKKNADMTLGLKDTCISLLNGLKLKEVSRQRL